MGASRGHQMSTVPPTPAKSPPSQYIDELIIGDGRQTSWVVVRTRSTRIPGSLQMNPTKKLRQLPCFLSTARLMLLIKLLIVLVKARTQQQQHRRAIKEPVAVTNSLISPF